MRTWTTRLSGAAAVAALAATGIAVAPAALADIGSSLIADAGCSPTTLARGATVSASSPAPRFFLTGELTHLRSGQTYTYVWTDDRSDNEGSATLGTANADGVIRVSELAITLTVPVKDSSPKPFAIVDDSTGKGVASGRIGIVVRNATLCRVLGTLTAGSGGNAFSLAQQTDGNVVERNGQGRAVWSTGTAGHPGAHTTMQSDGNLVIRDAAGRAIWNTATADHANATLTLQTDSNIVLRDASGRAIWTSGIHR